MKIRRIKIKNYRNFQDFEILLNQFNLIVGENNIGKTNFVQLINDILDPNRRIRNKLNVQDFINTTSPISVEIEFKDLMKDKKIVDILEEGIIDTENDVALLKFKAKWNHDERDIKFKWNFIGVGGKKFKFQYEYHGLFIFNIIPSIRLAYQSIKNSKNSELNKVMQSYLPEFSISLELFKEKIVKQINDLIKLYENDEYLNKLIKLFLNYIKILESIDLKDLKEIGAYKIDGLHNEIKTELAEFPLNTTESYNSNKLEEITNGIIQLFDTFTDFSRRYNIQRSINVISHKFSELDSIKDMKKSFTDLYRVILPNMELDLELEFIKDTELLQGTNINVDSFPILSHGTGFQSYFVIILIIFRIKTFLVQNEINSTFIAIEEPEAHIYPYLQRQLIDSLKLIEDNFREENGINLQFIITSHSSNILSKVGFSELIIFRRTAEGFSYPVYLPNFEDMIKLFKKGKPKFSSSSIKKTFSSVLVNLFSYYSESIFSKCVILVEGDTEEGAIPEYAKKLGLNLDSFGISCVQYKGSHLEYYKLAFGILEIPFIAVMDKDKGKKIKDAKVFLTTYKAFEEEIVNTLPEIKTLNILSDILLESSQKDCINDIKGKVPGLSAIKSFEKLIAFYIKNPSEIPKIHDYILTWLKSNKGRLLGNLIGKYSEKTEIPKIYTKIINEAIKLSKGGIP